MAHPKLSFTAWLQPLITTLLIPSMMVLASNPAHSEDDVDSDQSSNSYAEWDWVPKSQLADPNSCDTGCKGAYVEPDTVKPDTTPKTHTAEAAQSTDEAPIIAEADNSKANDDSVELSGNVIISQGELNVAAEKARLNRNNNELTIEGHIEVRQPGLLLRAEQAIVNTETSLGQFNNAQFLLHESGTRGYAAQLERTDENTLILTEGMVTQCMPDSESWAFEAESIEINREEGWGSAKKTILLINQLPVLYLPYVTFPIDDRRKTGLLMPSMGSSSGQDSYELSTPYYINIAPNYDATIIPTFMTDRGTLLEVENRYLNQYGDWNIIGAYLKDNVYTTNPDSGLSEEELLDLPTREKRWLGHFDHNGKLGIINTNIDYTKVSDGDYFDHLTVNSLDYTTEPDHLNQQISFGFADDDWQVALLAQQKQTLDTDLSSQYKLMPQLTVERSSNASNFSPQWLFEAEITDFQHNESIDNGDNFTTGQRSFIETGVSYPMQWAAGFITPTIKLRNLDYQLDAVEIGADDSPSATTALATLDMGLIFERELTFNNSRYTQTLEPRLYYFYSDYEEQTDNPDFDTKELTFAYSQLFRDTRFSGHDRLDDANQVSVGITSRFINTATGFETLSASLGQIFYVKERRVSLDDDIIDDSLDSLDSLDSNKSYIATDLQYQPTERLWLSNSLIWDSLDDKLQEGSAGLHYQTTSNSLYNLTYRYKRDGDSNLITGTQNLEQADASIYMPVSAQWTLFSRLQYDLTEESGIDAIAGLQYEGCCWMVRMLYQESFEDETISSEPNGGILVENDYTFAIEFQLKGLGNMGNKVSNILNESFLGYEDLE